MEYREMTNETALFQLDLDKLNGVVSDVLDDRLRRSLPFGPRAVLDIDQLGDDVLTERRHRRRVRTSTNSPVKDVLRALAGPASEQFANGAIALDHCTSDIERAVADLRRTKLSFKEAICWRAKAG
jgi:hypothetical protein